MANEVQRTNFSTFLTSPAVKQKINEVIGSDNGTRFMTRIMSAVSNNPALQECEHGSLLNCAFLGESLNLTPSPQLGQYYIVPFKDNKNNRTVATFQIGYKGYLQLAMRSGSYKKINALALKNGELVKYDPLNEELEVKMIEDDTERENAETIGYYAMFEYHNGFRKSLYWSKKKMEAHAIKYSMGYKAKRGYTFWEKDFDAQGLKTMIRQLISKWGIMSEELQVAFEKDMSIEDDGKTKYFDNDNSFTSEEPKKEVSAEAKAKLANAMKPIETADCSEIKVEEVDFIDILKTELREKHNLELDKLATANNIVIDQTLAKSLLDNPALLKKYAGKAI
jgi:recombination protein RecT